MDGNTLCGATVSGPWAKPGGSTDAFTQDRSDFLASAVSLDASAGLLCALAGYAELHEESGAGCGAVRTAFAGRTQAGQ